MVDLRTAELIIFIAVATPALLASCAGHDPEYMPQPAGIEREQKGIRASEISPPPESIGAGAVQMIKIGDSKQSVLERLGSPNIFTSAEDGGELWIYDKISVSREAQVGRTSANSSAAIYQASSESMMTTIHFSADGAVKDIKYRVSRY